MKKSLFIIAWIFLTTLAFGQNVTVAPAEWYLEPGGSVTLTANGAEFYLWSPPTWLSDTVGPETTASPQATITYTVKGHESGAEKAVNGDFSQGNYGFESGYSYSNNLYDEGTYYVGENAHDYHPNFQGTAHGGIGNFMIVNGATTPGTIVWKETIDIEPHRYYAFSTWVCTVCPQGAVAKLQFSINGKQIGAVFEAPKQCSVWNKFYEIWYSGNSTSATIIILNQNNDVNGNDFGLDDISFCQLEYSGEAQAHVIVGHVSAENDMVQTCTGSGVTIPFLDNDTLLNNCNDLYCEIVEQPAHGLATINNNNEMIYTPYDGFDGADQFRYKIKCGVQSDEAWVFVDVGADLEEEKTEVQCDSFTWHGQFFDHSVDTMWRKSNEDGCDSVFILHLTVNKSVEKSIDTIVCNSLVWDSVVYNSTGNYTKTYFTMHGCDSTVTVNLTVYKSVERLIDTTVCDLFEWDGAVYDSTSEYTKTYSTMHGCDSIVTLNLTVNSTPEVSIHGPTSIYPVTSIVSGVYDYYIDTTNLVTVPDVQWEIDNDNWLLQPQGARCKLICLSTGSGVLRAWTEGEECDFGTELAIESSFFDVEENEQLLVLIFPNPVKHRLSINSAGVVHVGIYNVFGNLLEELQFDNDNQCIIDMNKYDAGLYLFAITTNMGKVYKTVIKE